MTKMRLILVAIAKSMAVTLAVLTFSSAIFGLFCIFAFHAKFSIKGCSILLAVSSVLWLWACWRSEEPALRTFITLLLNSTLFFLLFLGVSLLRFMLEHSDSIAAWHVIVLVATVALFWCLRGVAVRRNKQTERLIHEHDVA